MVAGKSLQHVKRRRILGNRKSTVDDARQVVGNEHQLVTYVQPVGHLP